MILLIVLSIAVVISAIIAVSHKDATKDIERRKVFSNKELLMLLLARAANNTFMESEDSWKLNEEECAQFRDFLNWAKSEDIPIKAIGYVLMMKMTIK